MGQQEKYCHHQQIEDDIKDKGVPLKRNVVKVADSQHSGRGRQQGKGTLSQQLRLPAAQSQPGNEAGPVEQFDVLPQALPHRSHQSGGRTGKQGIEEMQTGAGHCGGNKSDPLGLAQARHGGHILSSYMP